MGGDSVRRMGPGGRRRPRVRVRPDSREPRHRRRPDALPVRRRDAGHRLRPRRHDPSPFLPRGGGRRLLPRRLALLARLRGSDPRPLPRARLPPRGPGGLDPPQPREASRAVRGGERLGPGRPLGLGAPARVRSVRRRRGALPLEQVRHVDGTDRGLGRRRSRRALPDDPRPDEPCPLHPARRRHPPVPGGPALLHRGGEPLLRAERDPCLRRRPPRDLRQAERRRRARGDLRGHARSDRRFGASRDRPRGEARKRDGTPCPAVLGGADDGHVRGPFRRACRRRRNPRERRRLQPVRATVFVGFTVHAESGEALDTVYQLVGPGAWAQVNDLFGAANAGPARPGSFVTFTSEAPVFPFLISIDNRSGDSVYLEPRESFQP